MLIEKIQVQPNGLETASLVYKATVLHTTPMQPLKEISGAVCYNITLVPLLISHVPCALSCSNIYDDLQCIRNFLFNITDNIADTYMLIESDKCS